MILRDRVDVLDVHGNVVRSDVPAYVGAVRTVSGNGFTDSFQTIEETTCLLPADVEIPERNGVTDIQIRWRGDTFKIDKPPRIRRQHDRDHHQTLGLKRVS